MRAVDTNVLVRLIARDDPGQVAAAEAFVSQGAWVSNLVLAETVWVLEAVYGRNRTDIAAAVEMLLNHAELAVENPDAVGNALVSFRARPALGLTDCLLLEAARKAGHLPLGTFDRRLASLEGAQRL